MPGGVDLAAAALQLATTIIGAAFGALLGYRVAISAHVRERRHDFIIEQLRDFYAPMLALRDEISTLSDRCWDIRNNCFDADFFHKHVPPLYRKLAAMFSDKLWLASPATRTFHREVTKTVNRFQERVDNGLVDDRHMDSELKDFEALGPFFKHLEDTLDTLQRKLLPNE